MDKTKDRHTSKKVCNTRDVLRNYVKNGEFSQPNALIDSEYLKNHISGITFHVCHKKIVLSVLVDRLLGKRGILIQDKLGTEKLAVIHKK